MAIFATIDDAKASGDHMTIKCTCGVILDNCRCWSPDKVTNLVQDGCSVCQAKLLAKLKEEPA